MDGIATIRRIKELDPNLQCVIVTAYQDRNIEEIGKIFGPDFSDRWDYLSKPFTSAEITQKAVHLVAGWTKREQEKRLLEQLDLKQQREELIRELINDVLERVQRQITLTQEQSSPEKMKQCLETISVLLVEAEQLVHEILEQAQAQIEEAA